MKPKRIALVIGVIITFLLVSYAGRSQTATANLELAWNANTEPDLFDYRLYKKVGAAGAWTLAAQLPKPFTNAILVLTNTGPHFFRLTARSTWLLESAPTPEITFTPASVPSTPLAFRSVSVTYIQGPITNTITFP